MRVESRLPDASPNKSTALICAGLATVADALTGVFGGICSNVIVPFQEYGEEPLSEEVTVVELPSNRFVFGSIPPS